MEGKGSSFNLHIQARPGSGWLARSLHRRAVFPALVSELSAMAALSSWQSLACSQYYVTSLSESWGFRLLLLQCRSEPMGSSSHVNNFWQCGHMGRGEVGCREELEEASRPTRTAGNGHWVV